MGTSRGTHFSARPRAGWLARTGRAALASLIVVSALAMLPGAEAATAASGSVTGQITGAGGAPVANVTDDLIPLNCVGGVDITAITDSNGNYTFTNSVPAGAYVMTLPPPPPYPNPQYSPGTALFSSIAAGNTITVTAGQTLGNVNDQLVLGGT